VAEGVEGNASNAAAPAIREPFSFHWFDYDLTAGISFPGSFSQTDFNNRGRRGAGSGSRFNDFLYLNLGAQVQFGSFGAAITADLQQFNLSPATSTDPGLTLQISRWHALAAFGALDNQLSIGGGARVLALAIQQSGDTFVPASSTFIPQRTLMSMVGVAPEVGALYKPNGATWRVGASLRAPVSARTLGQADTIVDKDGIERAGTFAVPEKVVQPWEAEIGVALQAGPRPLNPPWPNPHEAEAPVRDAIARAREARAARAEEEMARIATLPEAQRRIAIVTMNEREEALRTVENQRLEEESKRLLLQRRARYANWPREKILLLASVLITAPSDNAIDVASFLDQKVEPFGQQFTFMPRVGIEAEPIPNWLRARVGSYLEPSRIDGGTPRQHLTVGSDIKLAPFDAWGLIADTMWRFSFAVDLAPRYSNWGVGFGAWH
jgi:hypothetical protein